MPDKMPAPVMVPAPCPQCGAADEHEAGLRCKAAQDETGEYSCAGEFDEKGVSVQPTPESIKAIDDWCDAKAQEEMMDCYQFGKVG